MGRSDTPIATVNAPATTSRDTGLSPTPIYFYQGLRGELGGRVRPYAGPRLQDPPALDAAGDVPGVPAGPRP
ncbi:hypothetical protein DQ384_11870 [Sphaerisporangium album]|uniref:Uncharacterized protein n=1 Tax=Sphaerisporangium album TaxID=509200 RepID=A0A367FNU7_9ACTN|nr:hypothetical protein [Sphaerisporangium album]RCG31397.1 hypothetical protein DQ384_11870 [Sphaerisporangium album]